MEPWFVHLGRWVFRANLGYGDEVPWSRIFSGWSNMIGYKMSSSHARVYTMAKTSLVKNFKHNKKTDMATNVTTLFV